MNKNVALIFNELIVRANWVNQKTDVVTTESFIREQQHESERGSRTLQGNPSYQKADTTSAKGTREEV